MSGSLTNELLLSRFGHSSMRSHSGILVGHHLRAPLWAAQQNSHSVASAPMPRRTWRIVTALAALLFLAGCGDKVTVVAMTGGPREYIDKANMFLATAVTLLGQGPAFWGQALRSCYYSALTLARVKTFRTPIEKDQGYHERVWQQSPVVARKYFRDTLRKVRGKHDYTIVLRGAPSAADDLDAFTGESAAAYEALLDDAEVAIERAYEECTGARLTCNACRHEGGLDCARDAARGGIAEYRSRYVKFVRDAQAALSAARADEDAMNSREHRYPTAS